MWKVIPGQAFLMILGFASPLVPGETMRSSRAGAQGDSEKGPLLFEVGAAKSGGAISCFAEDARLRKLVLTASNGFFDPGSFVARGPQPAPAQDRLFIGKHFDHLQVGEAAGAARWHIWTPRSGTLDVALYLSVPDEEAGAAWTFYCDGAPYSFEPKVSSGDVPQSLGPQVPLSRGRHTISLEPADRARSSATKINRLELSGDACRGAKLLRARWRPAAVHTAYSSSTCSEASMWVFETRSLTETSSYAPINTPFGYFGTTFDPSRTTPRGLNFSMWATAKGKEMPPLADMPHLIATGNPDADFSGFGHEGSGVKLRGWDCLDWSPTSAIQALRVERRGARDYYFGYFYHGLEERWVLYAAGARPPRRKNSPATFSRVTAFVEVPGPPDRQRTGDVERKVARRGWLFGTDGVWHAMDVHSCKDKQNSSSRRIGPAEEGWHVSLAGGMDILDSPGSLTLPPARGQELPPYLRADKASQLFELPVRFESHGVESLRATSATVHYALRDLGENASATLYYGPVDALTFVSRELHGTERKGASADFYTGDRVWRWHTEAASVQDGRHGFQLQDLEPRTTYFYRVFVKHASGKSWGFDTGTFTTPRSGHRPR